MVDVEADEDDEQPTRAAFEPATAAAAAALAAAVAAILAEEEEADLCNKLVILLEERVLLIEFLGLFCREVDDNDDIVDCGEFEFAPIKDLDGVECTDELMAA